MKSLALTLIFKAIRQIIDANLFAHITKLVELEMSSTLKGVDKKAAVMKEIAALKGDLGEAVKKINSQILSMGVDIAVAEVSKRLGKITL